MVSLTSVACQCPWRTQSPSLHQFIRVTNTAVFCSENKQRFRCWEPLLWAQRKFVSKPPDTHLLPLLCFGPPWKPLRAYAVGRLPMLAAGGGGEEEHVARETQARTRPEAAQSPLHCLPDHPPDLPPPPPTRFNNLSSFLCRVEG